MSIVEYSNAYYKTSRAIMGYSENGSHRFTLEFQENIKSNFEHKNILFIGLNPADATFNKSDKTTNEILNLAHSHQATNVVICNICSFCSAYFSDFDATWMMEHKENLHHLKIAIAQSDMIIAFWGGGACKLQYPEREDIYNLIKNKSVHIGGQTNHFFPKQILQRDNSFSLQETSTKITKTLNL